MFNFKYHGNYCGPGYTGGKFVDQGSKGDYTVPPLDDLDSKCRQHDWMYENGLVHEGDKDLVNQTTYGFHKEGALKIGFQLKRIYNSVFLPKDMAKKKGVLVEVVAAKTAAATSKSARRKMESAHANAVVRRNQPKVASLAQLSAPSQGMPVNFNSTAPRSGHKLTSFRRGNIHGWKIIGTELLSEVVLSAPAVLGDLLASVPISPSLLGGTDLSILSEMFEFYKFSKMSMSYVPSVGTNTTGQLVGFFDEDPNSIGRLMPNGVSNISNVKTASDHEGAAQNQVFAPMHYDYMSSNANPQFYVDPNYTDARTSIQAVFLLVAASGILAASLGNLYLHYEVELWGKEYSSIGSGNAARLSYSPAPLKVGNYLVFSSPHATVSGSNLPLSFGDGFGVGTTFLPPPGYYLIVFVSVGTSLVNAAVATADVTISTIGAGSIVNTAGTNALQVCIGYVPTKVSLGAGFGFSQSGTQTGLGVYVVALPTLSAASAFTAMFADPKRHVKAIDAFLKVASEDKEEERPLTRVCSVGWSDEEVERSYQKVSVTKC